MTISENTKLWEKWFEQISDEVICGCKLDTKIRWIRFVKHNYDKSDWKFYIRDDGEVWWY